MVYILPTIAGSIIPRIKRPMDKNLLQYIIEDKSTLICTSRVCMMKILLRSRGICDDVIASLLGEDCILLLTFTGWGGKEERGRSGFFLYPNVFLGSKLCMNFLSFMIIISNIQPISNP